MNKKNKKRGFTLVELLAAVVILGLLAAGVVVGVSQLIKKQKQNYYIKQEELVIQAGREYFNDNHNQLPIKINDEKCVTLDTLISNKYIAPVEDYNKETCDAKETVVCATKKTTTKYSYKVNLECKEKPKDETNYNVPTVTISGDTSPGKNKRPKVEFEVGYSDTSDPNKNPDLSEYTYYIYKMKGTSPNIGNDGDPVFWGSGALSGKKTPSPIKITEFDKISDGTYYVVVNAVNSKGKKGSKTSGTIKIQTGLNCDKDLKLVSNGYESTPEKVKWINVASGNKAATVEVGSGVKKVTITLKKGDSVVETKEANTTGIITYNLPTTDGEYKYIAEAENVDGDKCEVNAYYNIDKTAPVCTVTSDKTTWTNTTQTLTAKCTDSGSKCETQTRTQSFSTEKDELYDFGTVKDKAGNIGTCNKVRVMVDKTKPECTIVANGSVGNNNWYITDVSIKINTKSDDKTSAEDLKYITTDSQTAPTTIDNKEVVINTDTKNKIYHGYVKDLAGNVAECKNSITIKRDTTPPICNITATGDKAADNTFSNNVTLSINPTDNVSDIVSKGLDTANYSEGDYKYNDKTSVQHTTDTTGTKYYSYVKNDAGLESKCEYNVVLKKFGKVTFNVNGGNAWTSSTCANPYNLSGTTCSKNVRYTANYESMPTPTRTGYTFDGWYTSATGGTKIISTTIKNNSNAETLYAHWIVKEYTIGYELNNGSFGAKHPTTGKYDVDVEISAPTKTVTATGDVNGTGATISAATSGTQTFAGWTSNSTDGLQGNAKSGTAANPTTAWTGAATKNTHFINLRNGNGTVKLTATWTPKAFNLPTVSKTGSTCNWNTKADGTGTTYASGASYTPTAGSAASITVFARCTANTYEVKYSANGGSGAPATQTKTQGVTLTLSSTKPTKSNSTFAGWKATDNTMYVPGGSYTKNEGTTMTAQWCNNCQATSPATCSLKAENGTCTYTTTCPTGYTITNNGKYNPSCTTCNYTVKFNKNASDAAGTMSNETFSYGTAKALTSNGFTRPGYTFTGWATSATGSVAYTNGQSVKNLTSTCSGTVNLYAVWRPNVCSITYSPNGGVFNNNTTNTAQSCNYNPNENCTDNMKNASGSGGYYNATREGYNIPSGSEWTNGTSTFNQDNAYKATDFCPNLKNGDQSVTIKVNWKVNVCTITYSPNGGVFNNNATNTVQECNYNPSGNCTDNMRNASGSDAYYNATRVGYDIPSGSEWINETKTFNQANAYKATDFCPNLKNGNQSTTVKVNWTAKIIKVTFNKNDGSSSPETKTQTFTYGKSGQAFSQTFTRTGYTLQGWALTSSATEANYDVDNGVRDNWINNNSPSIPLYAVWKPNTYKIQYKSCAGTTLSQTTSCTYGTNCSLITASTSNGVVDKTGYNFSKWTINSTNYSGGASVKNLTTTNNGTVTATAYCPAIQYFIKYTDCEGNTLTDKTKCIYDQNCTLSAALSQAGYTFNKWKIGSTTYNASGTVKNLATSYNGTVTAAAQCSKKAYNLTVNANGGTMNNGSVISTWKTTFTYGTKRGISTNNNIYWRDDTPTVPSRTGYTFNGWAVSAGNPVYLGYDGEIPVYYIDGNHAGDITATAKWNPKTYSLAYELNKGTHGANHPTGIAYDAEFLVSNPTKKITLTFINKEGATVDYKESSVSESGGSVNYSFNGWGITGMDSVTHTYGTLTTTNTSIASTKATKYKNLRSTSGTVTFTASWEGPTITLPKVTKSGSTCVWTSDGLSDKASGGTYAPTDATERTFTAKCTENKPKIKKLPDWNTTKYCTLHNGYASAAHGSSVKECNEEINGTNCYTAGYNHWSWDLSTGRTIWADQTGTDTYSNIKISDISFSESDDGKDLNVSVTISLWTGVTHEPSAKRYVCLKKNNKTFTNTTCTSNTVNKTNNWTPEMTRFTETYNLKITDYANKKGNYSFKLWKDGYSNRCVDNIELQRFSFQTDYLFTIE